MNLKTLIATLTVLGSSTAAMAQPVTLSASARGSFSFGTRQPVRIVRRSPAPAPIIIRDHRTPMSDQVNDDYVRYTNGYVDGRVSTVGSRIDRETRWDQDGDTRWNQDYGTRWDRDYDYQPVHPVQPLSAANEILCRNWDPNTDVVAPCEAFRSGPMRDLPEYRGWISLGSRESSVSDNQFITVDSGVQYRQLRIEPVQGRPQLTTIYIRYMDGTTQLASLSTSSACNRGRGADVIDLARKPIDQIVFRTASGSRGSYAVSAL